MAKSGVDVLISIKDESGEFKVLGGQLGADLNESRSLIDVTTKDSGGNQENEPGLYNWSIGCNGLIPEDKTTYRRLKKAVRNGEKVLVHLNDDDELLEGTAIPSDLPTSYPYDGAATYTLTLTGSGPLKVVEPETEPTP